MTDAPKMSDERMPGTKLRLEVTIDAVVVADNGDGVAARITHINGEPVGVVDGHPFVRHLGIADAIEVVDPA
jgi:hypothetical protein